MTFEHGTFVWAIKGGGRHSKWWAMWMRPAMREREWHVYIFTPWYNLHISGRREPIRP